MQIKEAVQKIKEKVAMVNWYSKEVLKIGVGLMTGFYIIAIIFMMISFFEAEYFIEASKIYRGAIEAGNGCLAASVVAGVLCDIIYEKDIKSKE